MTPPLEIPKPAVIFWYRIYAVGLFVLYFLISVGFGFVWYVIPMDVIQASDPALPEIFYRAYFVFLVGMSFILAGAFAVSFFLKNQPWTWIYHLILICLGFSSPCCLPASIPLLIFWIRDDCRQYFGRI